MESLCICYKRQKLGLPGCVQAGSGRFLLRLDRGTICRAELGLCGSDQLGSKSRLDPLPFTNFRGSSRLTPWFYFAVRAFRSSCHRLDVEGGGEKRA